jgi:hypothetical protein
MEALRVRVYNVRFGDAILVSVPEVSPDGASELRHIVIDVGNSLSTQGGVDTVFETVIDDVRAELAGSPLDLYVMTHEHMDHVQGLQYYQANVLKDTRLKEVLQVRHTWLTGSAQPGYYEMPGHERAKKRKDLVEGFLADAERYFKAEPGDLTEWTETLMGINNPRSTKDCVDLIRELAPADKTHYVYRGLDLQGKHPFEEATLEIWAPEENTSTYYGPIQPVAFAAVPGGTAWSKPTLTSMEPPPGVDAGAFYNLVEHRKSYGDSLLEIDSAANNTSVVFCLSWRGWKLLFPGDAEERSWREMDKRGLLRPVDFLKISHHGSRTGMLPGELLDKIMEPEKTPGSAPRFAALSAYPDPEKVGAAGQKWTYKDVPQREVLDKLRLRAELRQTWEVPDGGYIEYAFEGDTRNVTVTTSC